MEILGVMMSSDNDTKEKKEYIKPEVKTEEIEIAFAAGGGGGGNKVCNGNTNGGRKDTAANNCTVLFT